MSTIQTESGFARIGNAKLYYEVAGTGQPFVMLHAGVADSRQWNNEFTRFAKHFRTIRYDLRGYGKSEPVDGAFSHMADLIALLDLLEIRERLVIMGCSMGGGVAMDFALAHPSRVTALVMVDAGPSGLQLDVQTHPKAAEAAAAYNAGQLDLVAELETQIWFDGMGRTAHEVNQAMRTLAYDMNRLGLAHDAKRLGTRVPDTDTPAVERLARLDMPVLVIVGAHDTPYMLAAADYMEQQIRSARKAVIADAAHVSNMDQPDEFQRIVKTFLDDLPG
jgi:pimeloyl-ACP methyl ester carboxylesterase